MKYRIGLILLMLFLLPGLAQAQSRVTVRDAADDSHDIGVSSGADDTRKTDLPGEAGTTGYVMWIASIVSGLATMEWVNPVSNGFGWWTRAGTILSPVNANDAINVVEIGNTAGDLKIEPDVQGDVTFFEDTDVNNAANGKELQVWRKAAEGDDHIKLYISNGEVGIIHSDTNLVMQVASGKYIRISSKSNLFLGLGDNAGADELKLRDSDSVEIFTIDSDGHIVGKTQELTQASTTGNALRVYRDLALANTDSPVVQIIQDNVDDDQDGLRVTNDGSSSGAIGIRVITAGGLGITSTSVDEVGITGSSTNSNGIRGFTISEDNDKYGVLADQMKVGLYGDFDEGAAPDPAPTGDVRTYALTGGRMYYRDDTAAPDGIVGPLGSELAELDAESTSITIAPVVGQVQVTTVDATGGARTMTLPAASSWTGQFITIIKIDSTVNVVTVDGDGGDTIDGELTYDLVITNESITLVSDGTSAWFITSANLHHRIDITSYIDIKTKNSPSIHGGIVVEATADPLDNGTDLTFAHGQGRIMIVVNAGTDTAGTVTITGTSVLRADSDSETGADTEAITVAGLTTDNSANDGLGFNVWDFQDAYLSTKWFQGSITLSTTNLDLSDVDVYLINYDQFGDHPDVILQALEAEGFKTNTAGGMSVHLYSVLFQTGSKFDVQTISSLEHAASKTDTDRRVKMRETGIALKIDGSTDGILMEMNFLPLNQAWWEDVTTHIYLISLGDL